jgi:hypothetical protein
MSMSSDDLQELRDLRRWRLEVIDLLTVSEAFTSLLHDINNGLNTIMLQASLIDMKIGDAAKEETALIRKECTQAAARLAPFHHTREQRRKTRAVIDVSHVAQRVLATSSDLELTLETDLCPGLHLSVNELALEQLVHILLHAVRDSNARPGARIVVRTQQVEQQIRLVVGPDGPVADYVDLLKLQHEDLASISLFQRLAAQSLARLLQAELSAALGPGGKLSLCAAWSTSSEAH